MEATSMKRRQILILVILIAMGIALYFFQSDDTSFDPQTIRISDAVAVAVEGEAGSVSVQMQIENTGAPIVVISASSPEANSAKIMGLENSNSVTLPGNDSVSLASDGAHLMLNGVSGQLEDGRLIPLTLTVAGDGVLATKARLSKPMKMAGHQMGAMVMDGDTVLGDNPAPDLAVDVVANEANRGWMVSVEVSNFRFAKDLVDGDHVPGTGHGHVYVNGTKLGRLYSNQFEIGPLPKGKHLVRVTLNTNDHQTYRVDGKPITATVEIVEE